MKFTKFALAAIALLALGITAAAQQSAAQPTQGGVAGLSAHGKIAFINTNAFQEKIAEYKAKVQEINRKFEPRVKEVQSLADKINSLENTVKTQASVLGAAKIAEMTEQIEQMKKEYQRKAEDLQAEGNREQERAFRPLNEKLLKFAQAYTAKRGITMLVDLPNAFQSNTLIWYDSRLDVTEDFINEYNKANPVQAAPAPAPSK